VPISFLNSVPILPKDTMANLKLPPTALPPLGCCAQANLERKIDNLRAQSARLVALETSGAAATTLVEEYCILVNNSLVLLGHVAKGHISDAGPGCGKHDQCLTEPPKEIPTAVREVVSQRLAGEAYRALEKKMLNVVVNSSTTKLEAAYKLGIAAVLHELRIGYVVEES
jgi:hypothetical protein